jgi:hypothetical protein
MIKYFITATTDNSAASFKDALKQNELAVVLVRTVTDSYFSVFYVDRRRFLRDYGKILLLKRDF